MDELTMPGEPTQEMLEVLKRELEPGENLVWKAAPDRDAFVRGLKGARIAGLFFAAFSLFWMGGTFWITLVANKPGAPKFFPLFGLPFLIIGLALSFGTVWGARRKAARSVYGLTPRRAIVIEGAMQAGVRTVYSYRAERLDDMSKRERPDGGGDLIFEQVNAGYSQNNRAVYRPRGFLGVADVHRVESLVKSTLKVPRNAGVLKEEDGENE